MISLESIPIQQPLILSIKYRNTKHNIYSRVCIDILHIHANCTYICVVKTKIRVPSMLFGVMRKERLVYSENIGAKVPTMKPVFQISKKLCMLVLFVLHNYASGKLTTLHLTYDLFCIHTTNIWDFRFINFLRT